MNSFQKLALFGGSNFSAKKKKPSSGGYTPTVTGGSFNFVSIPSGQTTTVNVNPDGTISGTNWTLGVGTGTSAFIGNGSTSYYSGTLPYNMSTQYLIASNGTSAGGNVQTLTQTLTFTSSGTYYLNFYILPGAQLSPTQSLSVTLGNPSYTGGLNILSNFRPSGMVANGAPIAVTIPFVVPPTQLTMTLGFVFYCADNIPSYLGITNVNYVCAATPSQQMGTFGTTIIDPSALTVYLPLVNDYNEYSSVFNPSTTLGTVTTTYSGSAATAILNTPPTPFLLSSGCLNLNGNYVTVSWSGSLTIPSWSAPGQGFTMAAWFYSTGQEPNNALIMSLRSKTAVLAVMYYAQQNFLVFRAQPWGTQCGVSNPVLYQNTWNHVALVGTSGSTAGNTSYTLYLNGAQVATTSTTTTNGSSLIWPQEPSYNNLYVGYDPSGGTDISAGYFNGYMNEVRFYRRPLSLYEINELVDYPATSQNYANIDPLGMKMYYTFDNNVVNMYSAAAVNTLFAGFGGSNWLYLTGTGGSYAITNISAGTYLYGLPSNSGGSVGGSSFLTLTTSNTNGSYVTAYQILNLMLSSPLYTASYVLSFAAFPLDANLAGSQTLTVSLGKMILLNQAVVVSPGPGSSTPYTFYSLPFTVPYGTYLPLAFTVSYRSGGGGAMSVGIADLSLVTVGVGYAAVDPSQQLMYYPVDLGNVAGGDYATGTGIVDASFTGTIVANTTGGIGVAQVGTGCIYFNSSLGQSMTLKSMTVTNTTGLSFSGWFYPTGAVQATNAVLFSFTNTTGGSITCFFNGANGKNWLDFSCNPGPEYVAWSYQIVPNTWNHVAYVIQYTGGSNATHSYYVNDICMGSIGSSWVNTASTYNTNMLGYRTGLGYYNGYIDDFRVYNRALTYQDVFGLWSYGYQGMGTTAQTLYGNILDSSGLQLYYSFDQGSCYTALLPSIPVAPTVGTIGIGSIQVNYGTPNAYYYVSVIRTKNGVAGQEIAQLPQLTSYVDVSLTGTTADSSFVYTLRPYSQNGVGGLALSTVVTSPTPDVSYAIAPYTVSKGTVTVWFNSAAQTYNSFYDVSVSLTLSSLSTTSRVASIPGVYNYSKTFTDLSSSLLFNSSLVPHNAIGNSGNTYVNMTNISPTSDVSLVGFDVSIGTVGITISSASASYMSFYDVSIGRVSGGTVTGTLSALYYNGATPYRYVDSSLDLSGSTAYTYLLTSYNALNISGGTYTVGPVSPYPTVAFTSYTNITRYGLTVNYTNGNNYQVNVMRCFNAGLGGADVSLVGAMSLPVGATSFLEPSGTVFGSALTLYPTYYYYYGLTPMNYPGTVTTCSGGMVITPQTTVLPDVSLSVVVAGSYSDISTNQIKVYWSSASRSYVSYYDVSIVRISVGTGAPAPNVLSYYSTGVLDYSYVDLSGGVGLTPNTQYQYLITSYNVLGVPYTSITTPVTCTLPTLTGLSVVQDASRNINVFAGSTSLYSYSNLYRTDGASFTNSSSGLTFIDSSNLIANNWYGYTVVPYNSLSVSGGLLTTGLYQFTSVNNGFFLVPDVSFGTASFLPTVSGWTISATTAYGVTMPTNYYVTDGSGNVNGMYGGSLPANCSQYVVVGSGGAGMVQTMRQTVFVPATGAYWLTVYVFPGYAIDPSHTMTLSVGGMGLIYNYSLGAVANGAVVPLTLPFYGAPGVPLTLTMGFNSSNANVSNYCVTGLQVFGTGTSGFGRGVIDPSMMTHYYCFTGVGSSGFWNYAGGGSVGVADSSWNTGAASIVSGGANLLNGQGYLNVASGGWMNSSTNVVYGGGSGAGVSVAGWFYVGTTPGADVSMVTLTGSSSTVMLMYRANNTLGVNVTGTGATTISSGRVYTGVWNHMCVVMTNGLYVMYVNGLVVGNVSGLSVSSGAYSVMLGGGSGSVFVGYMTDVRVYGRGVSAVEMRSLWNLGASNVIGEVIDTYGMICYYTWNGGCVM